MKTYTRKVDMKPFIVKELFIVRINFKTDTCQRGTNNCLSNITGEIPKLQKFTGKHQQFKISLGETQISNTQWGGRKSKSFSPGTDFVGLIFTGDFSGADSARVLRKGVLTHHICIVNSLKKLIFISMQIGNILQRYFSSKVGIFQLKWHYMASFGQQLHYMLTKTNLNLNLAIQILS